MRAFLRKHRGVVWFVGFAVIFVTAIVWAQTTHTLDALRFLAGSLMGAVGLLVVACCVDLVIGQVRRRYQRVVQETSDKEAEAATHLALEAEDWLRSDDQRRRDYYGEPRYFEPPASQRNPDQPIQGG